MDTHVLGAHSIRLAPETWERITRLAAAERRQPASWLRIQVEQLVSQYAAAELRGEDQKATATYNAWRAAGHTHEDAMYAVRMMKNAAATAEASSADAGAGDSSTGSLPSPVPA